MLETPASTTPGYGISQNGTQWRITKRDGTVVPFDRERIRIAVTRCFKTIGQEELGPEMAETISGRVVNVITALLAQVGPRPAPLGVEDVQRLVIQSLWAEGQYAAAEHYTLYREERRRQREARSVDPVYQALVAQDQEHFRSPLQYYQFVSKFARWRPEDQRRETWTECVHRVFSWFSSTPGWAALRNEEKIWLREMMYGLQASPAMRVVQMAGPPLERCHVGAYNCAYLPIADVRAFSELLYILMQGTGVGFSVESHYVERLPRVKKQRKEAPIRYTIPDTTEGWCDALQVGLVNWLEGRDVDFDYSEIRPKGAPLATKGGQASGPEPLRSLLSFARSLILGQQGRRLQDIHVHDLCCMIGKIVQVGGVRRASEISLSDLESQAMRHAKHGNWALGASHRAMANNSAVYTERPPIETFMDEFLALIRSRAGERGIFNREGAQRSRPKRRKRAEFGVNPCAEILLRDFEFCNLSIAVVRPEDSWEEVREKVRAATYFGTLQACCTSFRYIRPDWLVNCEEERLLGVDIMGHLDHPLLEPLHALEDDLARDVRRDRLRELQELVREVNQDLSERMGVAVSAATTCLKPGGDSGAFFGSSNLSPWFAPYQIRRTRENRESPVAKMLVDQGVPHEEAAEDPQLLAFAWLKANPPGCITRDQMTALQQLENWLDWRECWAEHSCSVTVYVRDDEWLDVAAWCYRYFDRLTGVSFLPYDNGTYRTVPHEAVTEAEFQRLSREFPTIDWSQLTRYEKRDETTAGRTYACSGDICELL